jgi:hypothetical protein
MHGPLNVKCVEMGGLTSKRDKYSHANSNKSRSGFGAAILILKQLRVAWNLPFAVAVLLESSWNEKYSYLIIS